MKIFRINTDSEQESQDKKLREKMAEHSVQPPSFAWDNIESELGKPSRQRRRFIFFLAALAACVAGITIGVLTFLHTGSKKVSTAEATEINTKNEKTESRISNSETEIKNDNSANFNEVNAGKESDLAATKKPEIKQEKSIAINTEKNQNNKNSLSDKTLNYKQQNSNKDNVFSTGNKLSAKHIKTDNSSKTDENKPLNTINSVKNNSNVSEAGFNENLNENIAGNIPKKKDSSVAIINTKPDSLLALQNEENENKEIKSGDEKQKTKGTIGKKWSLGINAAFGASFRDITEDFFSTKQDVLTTSSGRNSGPGTVNEKPALSFSAGMSAAYKLSSRYSLQSGINYVKNGYVSEMAFYTPVYRNPTSNTAPVDTNRNGFVSNGYGTEKSSAGNYDFDQIENSGLDSGSGTLDHYDVNLRPIHNYFEWIRIPLQLRISSAEKGKINWFVQPGFSASFLLNKYAVLVRDQHGMKEENKGPINGDFNYFGIGANISAGLEIALGKDISFELRPEFEYQLRSLINNNDYGLHQYTYQINTGIKKYF